MSLLTVPTSREYTDVGWALTLLSVDNLSYASTAQSIGLNTGYFLSFTVFLAFNSPEFANKYFRSVPMDKGLVSLGGYLKFWGWMYIFVTIWLARYKKEEQTRSDDGGVMAVYQTIWKIIKLPRNCNYFQSNCRRSNAHDRFITFEVWIPSKRGSNEP